MHILRWTSPKTACPPPPQLRRLSVGFWPDSLSGPQSSWTCTLGDSALRGSLVWRVGLTEAVCYLEIIKDRAAAPRAMGTNALVEGHQRSVIKTLKPPRHLNGSKRETWWSVATFLLSSWHKQLRKMVVWGHFTTTFACIPANLEILTPLRGLKARSSTTCPHMSRCFLLFHDRHN